MSSSNKKTFKTSEASKAANATVTSNAILLDPTTEDHVLVVTVGDEGTSSTSTSQTLTRNYPAQDSLFYYHIRNNGNANRAWFETTNNVFKSYDFSEGISWYFSGSQGYYHVIDKTEIFKVEFTDGSYVKWSPSGTNAGIEYRDGAAGTIKTFIADSQDSLLQYLASQSSSTQQGNEFESQPGQAEIYIKTAFSVGPNGYKVTTAGDFDSSAQSLQTLSLTAGNGASWTDLDFSSKTHSKTILFKSFSGNGHGTFRPDILAIGTKELTFNTLLCKWDASDAAITGGTDSIADAFSKDYDRFFLFSDGDQDDLTTSATSTNKPIADVTIKSHGDSGAVTLEFKAENYNNTSVARTEHNWTYTTRTDLPNWHNSAGSASYDTLVTGTGSNLSGAVDIELEMSPDGENWCPVKTESSTSSGGTAGVSAANANLKAISTTPTSADPYKNKFALGSLSYNSSGVQLTTEDSGTQDFMQSFIHKDKPFNYSLWMKTDTSEQAFNDNYTPVLFRHGGKDKFKNEKVVKLDSSTTTTFAITVSNPGSGNLFYIDGVSSATAVDLVEGNTYIFDQSDSSSAGHPLRFSTTSNGSHGGGSEYTTGVTVVGTPGSAGAYTKIVVADSAPTLYYYCTQHSGMGGQLNTLTATLHTQNLSQNVKFSNSKYMSGGTVVDTGYQARIGDPYQDWTVIQWITPFESDNTTKRTDQPNIQFLGGGVRFRFGSSTYIGGNYSRLQLIMGWYDMYSSAGTVPSMYSPIDAYPYGVSAANPVTLQNESFMTVARCNHDSSTGITVATLQVYNSIGTKITDTDYTFTPTTAMPTIPNYLYGHDETVAYDTALNDAEIQAHFKDHPTLKQIDPTVTSSITYTNTPVISPVDPTTLNTWSDAILYLRGGDASGDSSTAMQNIAGSNTHFPASLSKYSSSANLTFSDVGTSKGVYLPSNDSQSAFSINSNLSISGWFKTTDTGMLLSNSSNGSDGLRLAVNASDMTLSFGSQDITLAADVNDGNWHHILISKPNTAIPSIKVHVDGSQVGSSVTLSTITDDDLKGSNGFTLLGNGQNNINAASTSATDASKLKASLSNWSLHKEIFDNPTIAELYSNGHVRNLKNLVGVDSNLIEAWWSLSDLTSPGQDEIGSKDLIIVDKGSLDTINGKGIKASSQTTSGTYATRDFILNGNKNPFGDNNDMPGLADAWSMSYWLNIPNTGSTFDSIIAFSATDTRNHFKLHQIGNTNLAFSFAGAGEGADYSVNYTGKFNAWHHIVMIKPANTVQDLVVFIDGVRVAVTQTYAGDQADPATTSWDNQDCSEFFLFGNSRSYTSNGSFASGRTGRSFKLDQLATFTGALTHNTSSATDVATGQVYELWNNGNYKDVSTISTATGVALQKYFKFGDHASDVNSGTLKYFDDVNDTAYFQEQDNTDGGTYTLTGTESFYKLAPANLVNNLENAVGAPLILEEDQYGSGITMSITKRFDISNYAWTNTHTHQACICLSFNGFEDQAEYYAIYKYNSLDIADNNWHNIILSFSGKNGSSTNTTTNLSFSSSAHNIVVSFDGNVVNDAIFVGGVRGTPIGKTFPVADRHLKWSSSNNEEDYMPHCQLNSNIFKSINQTTQKYEPVVAKDYKTAFIGYADESSFHSESWFVNANGDAQNSFNDQKVATIYGSTTTPSNRGPGTDFPVGTPYPLRNPTVIGTSAGATGNQYIDPEKFDASSNPDGGLEAWWRWGDTAGDCTENINDSIGFESEPLDAHRSLKARNFVTTLEDPDGAGPLVEIPKDLFYLTSSDSIHLPVGVSGSTSVSLVDAVIENIQVGVCNLKNLTSPILQYIRVKFKGTGSAELGSGKTEASVWYSKRRKR